ncbi:MFS transporter [Candidatus Sumerlaeota bacterium]|nr:MFS transporter [Candidatus Sumerlaeota bacterium]
MTKNDPTTSEEQGPDDASSNDSIPNGRLGRFLTIARALRHRNYRLFFLGQGLSLIGSWMQRIALGWLVFRLTGSVAMLGIVSFCGQIMAFPLSPFAGVLADRTDRRTILIATQSVAMTQAFLMAILTLTGQIAVWHIVALALMLGLVNAFDIPIRQSFVVEMVDNRDDLPNAIALNSFMFNSARLIGPTVAGATIAVVGEGICFLINGLSFIAVIAALSAMRIPPIEKATRQRHVLQNLGEGLRYAFRSAPIRSILFLLCTSSLLVMPYIMLMPSFAKDVLHGTSRTYGYLMGASGVGALAGVFRLATRKSVRGLGRVIAEAGILYGVALVGFALSRNQFLSMGFLLLVGFGMMTQNVSCNTLIQTIVDDTMRGRVMSFWTLSMMGIAPLGSLLAGKTGEHWGSPRALALMSSLYIVSVLFFATRLPRLGRAVHPIYVKLGLVGESPPIGSKRVDLPSFDTDPPRL